MWDNRSLSDSTIQPLVQSTEADLAAVNSDMAAGSAYAAPVVWADTYETSMEVAACYNHPDMPGIRAWLTGAGNCRAGRSRTLFCVGFLLDSTLEGQPCRLIAGCGRSLCPRPEFRGRHAVCRVRYSGEFPRR